MRVHQGQSANEAATLAGANAFTIGSDIVFGNGAYAPGTRRGDDRLAHELAHSLMPQARTRTPLLLREEKGETESNAASKPSIDPATFLGLEPGSRLEFDFLLVRGTGEVTTREPGTLGVRLNMPAQLEFSINEDQSALDLRVYLQLVDGQVIGIDPATVQLPIVERGPDRIVVEAPTVGRVALVKTDTGTELRLLPLQEGGAEIAIGRFGSGPDPRVGDGSDIDASEDLFPRQVSEPVTLELASMPDLLAILALRAFGRDTGAPELQPQATGSVAFPKQRGATAIALALPIDITLDNSNGDLRAVVNALGFPVGIFPVRLQRDGERYSLLDAEGEALGVELSAGGDAVKAFAGGVQVGALGSLGAVDFPAAPPWLPTASPKSLGTLRDEVPPLLPLGGARFDTDTGLMRHVIKDLVSGDSTTLGIGRFAIDYVAKNPAFNLLWNWFGADFSSQAIDQLERRLSQLADQVSDRYDIDVPRAANTALRRYLSIQSGVRIEQLPDTTLLAPTLSVNAAVPFAPLTLHVNLGFGLPIDLSDVVSDPLPAIDFSTYFDVAIQDPEQAWSVTGRFQAGTGESPNAAFFLFGGRFDENDLFER